MSEETKKVGRAIRKAFIAGKDWDGMGHAAIRAMRRPTKAMLAADMELGGYGWGDDCFPADPREIWRAMIDEALKD